MATNNDISDLLKKYVTIESEVKTLQEDKKQLLAEYKDKIDPKAFQSALRAARIMAKLKPNEKQDFDQILDIVEKALCIEHVS